MNKTKYIKPLVWMSYLVLMIVAGLGFQRIWTVWVGMAFSFFCLFTLIANKTKLVAPKNLKLYVLFLIFFMISLFWSNNFFVSFPHFLTFVTAGIFWLYFYNLKIEYPDTFNKLITVLFIVGIFFGFLFLLQRYLGEWKVSSFSLNGFTSINFNHHHVGDLFAALIFVAIYQILKNGKNIVRWLMFIIPGVLILFVSGSRSAYVSLACGLLYLFNSGINIKGVRKLLLISSLFLLLASFLYISGQKDLLMSREYYIQAILGLLKHPYGVGVGNFSIISSDPSTHLFGLRDYSFAVHNIVLEVVSGMGIFGFVFMYWFFSLMIGLLKDHKKRELLINSLLIVFAVNFFFDITYFIPTMLWSWFSLLGMKTE